MESFIDRAIRDATFIAHLAATRAGQLGAGPRIRGMGYWMNPLALAVNVRFFVDAPVYRVRYARGGDKLAEDRARLETVVRDAFEGRGLLLERVDVDVAAADVTVSA